MKYRTILKLFILGFLLNFLWEVLHSPLYECENCFTPIYLGILLYASVVDGVIVTLMYLGGQLMFARWWNIYSFPQILYVLISGVVIAVIIEYRAVFLLMKWSYSTAMPVVFGLGVSPLLQLAVTSVATFTLLRWFSLKTS